MNARLQTCLHFLVYILLRVMICIVQMMTIESCQGFARMLAWLAYDVFRLRRSTIDENLGYAFPELSWSERIRLGRRSWEHVMLIFCEFALLPRKVHAGTWRQYITFHGDPEQLQYFLQDRPRILLSGHLGNFEAGGIVMGLLGFPTYTVARDLDNPFLHTFLNQHRQATGQWILPKTGSAQAVDEILRHGGTLTILGDQSAGPRGCYVDFFGRPASCHKAVALFSLTYRAPLIIGYALRRVKPLQFDVGIAAVYDPVADGDYSIEHLTQWYCCCLEDLVRQAPEQYWWLHRRWKDKRTPRQRERAATRAA